MKPAPDPHLELRIAALREIANPVAAYDRIMPRDGHALDWLTGQAAPSPLAQKRMAMMKRRNDRARYGSDQAEPMYPRGSVAGNALSINPQTGDPDDETSAEDLMHFIVNAMGSLSPDERGRFVGMLGDMLAQDPVNANVDPDNQADPPARDRGLLRPAGMRAPAMDSYKAREHSAVRSGKQFAALFPEIAKNVRVLG